MSAAPPAPPDEPVTATRRAAWRRLPRAAARFVVRVLRAPATLAALVLVAQFAWELASAGQLGMMGAHDEEIQRVIFTRYGREILVEQLAIAGCYVAIGACWGLLAQGALSLWDRARARTPRPWPRRLTVAAIAIGLHLWRAAIAVIHYPQLYAESLYARGGVRRSLEIALTHHVPRLALELVGWAAIVALVVGPVTTARGRAWVRARVLRLFELARSRRPATAIAAAGVALASVAALRPTSAPAAPPDAPPNILILAVDSLRADRVGPGHEAVAPRLAQLASRGVQFQAAHITVPRTFPSWMTLLTGRWPAHHGIRTMFPSDAERRAIGPTLPSLLAARGYDTAVVSDFAGEIFSRVDVGFADRRVPYFGMSTVVAQAGLNLHPGLFAYAATHFGHRALPALEAAADNADPDRLADRIIEAVDDKARSPKPFLLTAFFSTAHFPYAAPDPYYRRFTDDSYRGPFRYHKPPPAPDQPDGAIGDADVAQVRGLYDGAVSAVDAAIGRVLDELARKGLADRTIVVIMADHGEGLYEPGRGMGHGEHLHGDAMLHIPLVVYDPVHRFPAHAVPGIVRDVDLAPTLAALAGGKLDGADGTDLAPLLRADRADLDLTAFAETGLWFTSDGPCFGPDERLPYPAIPGSLTLEGGDDIVLKPELREMVVVAKHRALRTARWKLYYEPTRAGVRWSLYDLASDPDERQDVASQHPNELRALEQELFSWATIGGGTVENGFVVPR